MGSVNVLAGPLPVFLWRVVQPCRSLNILSSFGLDDELVAMLGLLLK